MFTEYMMNAAEKQWTTKAGYEAIVVVQPQGYRCGYVQLPKGHRVGGIGYEELCINVHGGLTYGQCTKEGTIFGFDCGHFGDAPDMKLMSPQYKLLHDKLSYLGDVNNTGVIRTLEYCIDECENMAKQFKELENETI